MSDNEEQGALSLRAGRGGWRAHVPTALVIAVVMALNGGACTASARIESKLDDLSTRVARIEGALGARVSTMQGTEGTGGTGAMSGG